MDRRLAVDLFNETWTLIEKADRDDHDNDLMVDMAHASSYHWRQVGEPVNFARSHWQLSRVYVLVGSHERAMHHARRCLEICESNGIGGFDIAFAHEAIARASEAAGDVSTMRRHLTMAMDACGDIEDEDDRNTVEADLATIDT